MIALCSGVVLLVSGAVLVARPMHRWRRLFLLPAGLAIAIFVLVQIPFSRWWLARYEYGPMEYLWRVMTYGRAMSGQLRRSPL